MEGPSHLESSSPGRKKISSVWAYTISVAAPNLRANYGEHIGFIKARMINSANSDRTDNTKGWHQLRLRDESGFAFHTHGHNAYMTLEIRETFRQEGDKKTSKPKKKVDEYRTTAPELRRPYPAPVSPVAQRGAERFVSNDRFFPSGSTTWAL